jgi:exonuclease III
MGKWIYFLAMTSAAFGSMQFFTGNGKEMGAQETATLLTWNVYGLPNKLVAIRPWEDRIDGIANTILQEKADIVVLEECFERDLSLGLYERLKKEYAHIYLDLESKDTLRPSGLALFSKFPVQNLRFVPHPDLLDYSRNTKMGTIDFVITTVDSQPLAHIIASHMLGSSNFQWRTGMIEDGRRLTYEQVRQEEAHAILQNNAGVSIPQYLCGDLNVDRRSFEFASSPLNATANPRIREGMSHLMQRAATNTNFWPVHKGFQETHPSLSIQESLDLALNYEKICLKIVTEHLQKAPWNKPLAEFEESFFTTLESAFKHQSPKLWDYFKDAALKAIAKEQEYWKRNTNEGSFPPVAIGRVLEVSVVPIEEAIDFILGTNAHAEILEVAIVPGYDHSSVEKTLSDHHPVKATIRLHHPRSGIRLD